MADFNGDGYIDVVFGNKDKRHPIQYLINDGNGIFTEVESSIMLSEGVPLRSVESLAVADMDGDGRVDILVGTSANEANYILLSNGDDSFRQVALSEGTEYSSIIAVSDLNKDGRVDVIIGSKEHDNIIDVLLNKDTGRYIGYIGIPRVIPGDYETTDIAIADLDGDGLLDLAIGDFQQPNQVLLNKGDGAFEEVKSDISLEGKDTHVVAVGDLNGDGLPDIVVGNSNNIKNQVMWNQGS